MLAILTFQVLALGQIQFSGFADILFVQTLDEPNVSEIRYGQFEIDLSASIRPGISFEGAIALNPATGGFDVGAGFIEIGFAGEEALHPVRGKYLDHFGISVGQFDVPFGIDWQHIASPDRRLVSPPLLNEKSINGWNDIGLNLHTDLGRTTLAGFMVNGAADGFAMGGRASYSPLEATELGFSYMTQTKSNDLDLKPRVIGGDLQTTIGPLATCMEVHYTENLFGGDFEAIDAIDSHHGFYLQTDLDLNDILNIPLVLIGRYDDWSTINNSAVAQRSTLGLAYTLTDGFEVRTEYMQDIINGEQEVSQFVIQMLVSF